MKKYVVTLRTTLFVVVEAHCEDDAAEKALASAPTPPQDCAEWDVYHVEEKASAPSSPFTTPH